ncbi:MAG: hypothetical protein KAQ65_01320, partial [Candidatus Thorarchaeota archaeon]|nr:hypothetical protein [Candidatus Thorarchaeota archaeon]
EGLLPLPEPIDEDLEPILPRILGRLIRLRLPRPDFIRILSAFKSGRLAFISYDNHKSCKS